MDIDSVGNSEQDGSQGDNTTMYAFNRATLTLGPISETDDMSISGIPPKVDPGNISMQANTSAQEAFFTENKDGWKHGVEPPPTIFKYNRSENTSLDDRRHVYGLEQIIFTPTGRLGPVEHSTVRSKASEVPKVDPKSDEGPEKVREEAPRGGFSGYYSMPQQAINAPHRFRQDVEKRRLLAEIPHCCYHNNGTVNGISYIFGGLAASKYNDFSHLNIPNNVDPSKISIYFPYELPPFVSEDLLTSPYMVQNPHLIQFNAARNTITYLDLMSTTNVPWRLNATSSCLISLRHVFFFGGFEIEVESTEYIESVDRWIVRKKLIMNDFGYIFDSLTLKFAKIRLDLKNKHDIIRGRIGCGITANIYEPVESEVDIPVRIPLPPVFTDSSSDTDVLTNSMSPEGPGPRHPNIKVWTGSALQSTSTEESRQSAKSHSTISDKETKRDFAPKSAVSPSHGMPSLKMGNILEKSTKIFHLSHLRKASGNLSTGLNSHLTNTYSQEMSRVRSNSHGNSRPTSPVLKAQNNHVTTKNSIGPSLSNDQKYPSPIETDVKFIPTATPEHVDSFKFGGHKNSQASNHSHPSRSNTQTSRSELGADISSLASSDTSPSADLLFDDTVIKSGIVSVSVFIFGGFKCVLEGGQGKFKATNDLLKIDIGSKDDHESIQFMEEALIYSYGDEGGTKKATHSADWPQARGYFAFSLIEHHRSFVDNCKWDLYEGSAMPTYDDSSNSSRPRSPEPDKHKSNNATMQRKFKSPQTYFNGKAFLIQGGINEKHESFSDLYLFVFDTGKWTPVTTYVHQYFDEDKEPHMAKCRESENPLPLLVEAELRACHHTALYYKNEDRDYLFFAGGITKDRLKGLPRSNGKFDVSNYAKFLLFSENSYLLRMMVLNLQTQTWQFLRYYHGDICSTNKTFGQMVADRPWWKNTRICFAGGSIYMNEKSVNLCHGLAYPAPDSKEKWDAINNDLPLGHALWGAHVLFTFPSL